MNATRVQRTRMHGLAGLCAVLVLGLAMLPAGAQQIVVFEAHGPRGGEFEGEVDVYAQCLSPDGEPLWNGGDPVPVMSGSYVERVGAVLPDGSGGAIVIAEAVARDGEYAGDWEIIAQRVSADGRLVWEEGRRSIVVAATNWSERHPVAVADGRGGVFVLFEAQAPSGSQWAGDVDVRGQHLSAAGELLWQQGGVEIACSDALEQAPCAVADGAGGVIVGCEYMMRHGQYANDWQIGAQRVSGDGRLLWEGGQRSVLASSTAWLETRPVMVADGKGGTLVFCQAKGPSGSEWEGDSDVLGQRLGADGRLLWGNGEASVGVHTSAAWEDAPVAAPDGSGGAVVICSATPRQGESAGDWDVIAQRVSATGQLLWHNGEYPTLVGATALLERRPCAVPDGAGGVYVAFEGHHPTGTEYGGDIDLLAQRLAPDGRALWTEEGGARTVSASDYLECAPCIVADGQGGVIISFEAALRAGERAGDWQAAAQRMGSDGTPIWNAGAQAVVVCASLWGDRFALMPGGGVSARDLEGQDARTVYSHSRPASSTAAANPSTPQGRQRPATDVAAKTRR